MRALIIVDIQNDFLPGGNLAVNQGDQIIALVNKIQADYDLVVATQDWHPATHLSFASNHLDKKTFEVINLFGLTQVLWPDHCIQGTFGADFYSELKMNKVATIFRKGMDVEVDSYSGFYDNGKRNATGLEGYLKSKKVVEVHVCGLAADYCVYYTAKDALAAGFKTAIIENATRAIDVQNWENIKVEFTQSGGLII